LSYDELACQKALELIKTTWGEMPIDTMKYARNIPFKDDLFFQPDQRLKYLEPDSLPKETHDKIYGLLSTFQRYTVIPGANLWLLFHCGSADVRLYDPASRRVIRSFEPTVFYGERLQEAIQCAEEGNHISVLCIKYRPRGRDVANKLVFEIPKIRIDNGWFLCQISGAADSIRHEREFRKKLAQAESLLDQNQAPQALGILKSARGMPGFTRRGLWTKLYRRVSGFCRKQRLIDVTQSAQFQTDFGSTSFRLTADGKLLFALEIDRWLTPPEKRNLWALDAETGRLVQTLEAWGSAFALSPNGDRLAYKGKEGLTILNLSSGQETCLGLAIRETEWLRPPMAFHPGGRYLVADGCLFDTLSLKETKTEASFPTRGHIVFSPDGNLFAESGGFSENLLVKRFDSGATLNKYNYYEGIPTFSPDGKRLAVKKSYGITFYEIGRQKSHEDDIFDEGFKQKDFWPSRYTTDGAFFLSNEKVALIGSKLAVYGLSSGKLLMEKTLQNVYKPAETIELSPYDDFAFTGGEKLVRWDFDWDFELQNWSTWKEDPSRFLANFLKSFRN
jgi:hypothetical protein